MRLVIKREGGFDVIENSDDIKRIEPQNDGVRVTFMDGTDEFYPVESHTAACRLSAAIAGRCGVLVEPLAEQPGVVTESVMFDGGEVITPPPNPRWEGAKRSEWVAGHPPADGQWYVVKDAKGKVSASCWHRGQWWDSDNHAQWPLLAVGHLPTPVKLLGPESDGSQWVAGEPPRDGRWYVSNYGLYCVRLVRWSNAKGGWEDSTMSLFGGSGPLAHVPTPIPDAPTCT